MSMVILIVEMGIPRSMHSYTTPNEPRTHAHKKDKKTHTDRYDRIPAAGGRLITSDSEASIAVEFGTEFDVDEGRMGVIVIGVVGVVGVGGADEIADTQSCRSCSSKLVRAGVRCSPIYHSNGVS
jgi:hypothetical protein